MPKLDMTRLARSWLSEAVSLGLSSHKLKCSSVFSACVLAIICIVVPVNEVSGRESVDDGRKHGMALFSERGQHTSDGQPPAQRPNLPAQAIHPCAAHTAFAQIDTTTLPSLLEQRAFAPPQRFKAFIAVVHKGRAGKLRYQAYDYYGTSCDKFGDPPEKSWWPASTVKIYAAVAALEWLGEKGFTGRALVTFKYPEKSVTNRVSWLIQQAITPSDNVAFDRLVELVGMEYLNEKFFRPERGFSSTILQRGYSGRVKDPETGKGTLRDSPEIVIAEKERTFRLQPRYCFRRYACPDEGNCTTLVELAETMRRIMLHEVIPEAERFRLTPSDLRLLRGALAAPRERGTEVVKAMGEAFAKRNIAANFYHKPGFAMDWFSDVVFVQCKTRRRDYIVAVAGFPGRSSLDNAAFLIGDILAQGLLDKAAKEKP